MSLSPDVEIWTADAPPIPVKPRPKHDGAFRESDFPQLFQLIEKCYTEHSNMPQLVSLIEQEIDMPLFLQQLETKAAHYKTFQQQIYWIAAFSMVRRPPTAVLEQLCAKVLTELFDQLAPHLKTVLNYVPSPIPTPESQVNSPLRITLVFTSFQQLLESYSMPKPVCGLMWKLILSQCSQDIIAMVKKCTKENAIMARLGVSILQDWCWRHEIDSEPLHPLVAYLQWLQVCGHCEVGNLDVTLKEIAISQGYAYKALKVYKSANEEEKQVVLKLKESLHKEDIVPYKFTEFLKLQLMRLDLPASTEDEQLPVEISEALDDIKYSNEIQDTELELERPQGVVYRSWGDEVNPW